MPECICKVQAPRYEHATGREMIGNYAVRLSQVHDATRFDPSCPFHGENGSMVVDLRPSGKTQSEGGDQ